MERASVAGHGVRVRTIMNEKCIHIPRVPSPATEETELTTMSHSPCHRANRHALTSRKEKK